MIQAAVDYITTDNPALGKSLTATTNTVAPRSPAEEISVRYRSPGEILIQSPSEIASVALFDMQRRLRYRSVKSTEAIVSLSGLPAGIYMIQINNAKGASVRKFRFPGFNF
jgi:hypothetical protein